MKIRVDLNLTPKDNGYDILIDSGIVSGGYNKETAAVLSSSGLNLKGRASENILNLFFTILTIGEIRYTPIKREKMERATINNDIKSKRKAD